MREISKTHRVFLIDNPFTWKDYFRRKHTKPILQRKEALLKGKNSYRVLTENCLIAVTPRLMIPINWLPRGRMYNAFSAINEFIFSRCMQKLLQDYTISDFVYVNSFLPLYFKRLPPFFNPKLFIYQTVDDINHAKYLNKHGYYLENEMIRRADVTFTTSTHLYELKKKVANSIYIIPNAADISLFGTAYQNQLVVPSELREEKRKVIIYVGNTVAERTDFGILRTILVDHPNKLLLMIGPYDRVTAEKSGILTFPNIHFLGAKPIQDVPAYLQHSHCAIIPFQCNALTKSIYPLKINEYLATGVPVVTTSFSEDIISFSNIYLASGPNEFSSMVGKAIDEDSADRKKARVAEVAHNSWQERADRFLEIVLRACTEKHV